ncbi:hypothetical protein [Mitsuokella jalaludinii]|uniref:hypothetical protein n=1 Tax=Mitsuokella jalaludinii TaxID=187979 RepID=UPI002FD939A8
MKKNTTIKKEPVECPLSPGRSCLHCPSSDGCGFNGRISPEEREMTRCGMYSPPVPEWDVPFPDGDEQKTKKTKHIPANEGYTFGVRCRRMPKDELEEALKERYGSRLQPIAAPLNRRQFCKPSADYNYHVH